MKYQVNNFGLPRSIDALTKLLVRQYSGFGCVVCGNLFCDYEHVIPEYKDAKVHDPNCITLLCGRCHDNVTKKLWSKEKILEHMKKPFNIVNTESSTFPLDMAINNSPLVKIGSMSFLECIYPIVIRNFPILQIERGDFKGCPYKFSFICTDKNGLIVLRVVQNELVVNTQSWDIESSASNITIRAGKRDIVLDIKFEARGAIIINRMNSYYFGTRIVVDKHGAKFSDDKGMKISISNLNITGGRVGISI